MVKGIILIITFLLIGANFFEVSAQDSAKSETVTTIVGNPADSPSKPPPGEFPFYCQGDPRWASRCYLGAAGCGPTSTAMIISYFEPESPMSPPEVDDVFNARGYRACADVGSSMDPVVSQLLGRDHGFKTQQILYVPPGNQGTSRQLDIAQAKEYIDAGYLILASVSIHIFVIDQVDVDKNMVHLRDPARCNPAGNWNPNGTPWIGASGTGYYWFYAYAVKK